MFKFVMEEVIKNSVKIEGTLGTLRNELNILKQTYNAIRIELLSKENAELKSKVELAKENLMKLETAHGIKQYSIPSSNIVTNKMVNESQVETSEIKQTQADKEDKTVKKEVKKKPEKKQEMEKGDSLPVDVSRLDLRIGFIEQVKKHPDADSLYVSNIQCGDPDLRTVVSGLVKHVTIEELQGRKVVVLCNLKPAKMRGIISEAMVMCASTAEKVEVLLPPTDALPGDLVECEGFIRQPDVQLNPKKKIFETVAPDLKTNDNLQACYKDKPLIVPGKGHITSESLKNVNIK